jgi:hypothetical protein
MHSNLDLDLRNLVTLGLNFVHSIDPRTNDQEPHEILTINSNIATVFPIVSLTFLGHLFLIPPHLLLLLLLEVLFLSFGIKSL